MFFFLRRVSRICAAMDIYSVEINISALCWTNYGTKDSVT